MIWLELVGVALLAYVGACFVIVLILGAAEYKKVDVLPLDQRVYLRILRSGLFVFFIPLCFALYYAKKLTGRGR